ncbi:MAG: hypothetical protein EXR87_04520 [Gammaproteobacteria bacterium]|nr:hypothetical protein [Gammaproteobacteria bacterium]
MPVVRGPGPMENTEDVLRRLDDTSLAGAFAVQLLQRLRDQDESITEPVDFMARLAALVAPPRVHLTRFHGVFAPYAALRAG